MKAQLDRNRLKVLCGRQECREPLAEIHVDSAGRWLVFSRNWRHDAQTGIWKEKARPRYLRGLGLAPHPLPRQARLSPGLIREGERAGDVFDLNNSMRTICSLLPARILCPECANVSILDAGTLEVQEDESLHGTEIRGVDLRHA